jgi:ketosteroid isomerase-like protein
MKSFFSHTADRLRIGSAILLLLPLTGLTSAVSGTGPPHNDATRYFSQIETEWARALVAADKAALDRIESPSYVVLNAAGVTLTKAQADGELLNGHLHFESLLMSRVHAWQSGDLAVVTGHASTRESYLGKDTSGEFEYTDIFERKAGHWMAVRAQLTRVATSGT